MQIDQRVFLSRGLEASILHGVGTSDWIVVIGLIPGNAQIYVVGGDSTQVLIGVWKDSLPQMWFRQSFIRPI